MKHVPHLYSGGELQGEFFTLTSVQEHHVAKVLRMTPGDSVTYTDGNGVFGCGIWRGQDVERGKEAAVGRPSALVVAVSPPTNRDRSRFLVEKLAELGIESLLWLKAEWGSGRVPSVDKQLAWSTSALEQSRGAWLMNVSQSLVAWGELESPLVVCSPEGGEPGSDLRPRTVAIGPEGGFNPDEIPGHALQVQLGKTILRIETAAIAAAIMFT